MFIYNFLAAAYGGSLMALITNPGLQRLPQNFEELGLATEYQLLSREKSIFKAMFKVNHLAQILRLHASDNQYIYFTHIHFEANDWYSVLHILTLERQDLINQEAKL